MKKALHTIFSDAEHDLDFTKILGGVAFAFFLVFSCYAYAYKGSSWDPVTWASAVGVLLGSVGGVSKIKDFTNGSQPKQENNN